MPSENVYGAFRPADMGEAIERGQRMAAESQKMSDLARARKKQETYEATLSKHVGADGKLNKAALSDLASQGYGKEAFELGGVIEEQDAKAMQRRQAAHKAKVSAVGGALESLSKMTPEQRAAQFPVIRSNLMKGGFITEEDGVPEQYDDNFFQQATSAFHGTDEFLDRTVKQKQIGKFDSDAKHQEAELGIRREQLAQADRHKVADITGNARLADKRGQQQLQAIDAQGKNALALKGAVSGDQAAKLAAENDPYKMSPEKEFKRLPAENQEQITGIAKKQTNIKSINNEIKSALAQLSNPELSEDAKVKIGQGLLKTLNSTQGSDAVGAEESKRLGSFLEYKIANFTGPGSFMGRDMDQFVEQVGLTSNKLDDTMELNNAEIDRLYGRRNDIGERYAMPTKTKDESKGPELIKEAKAGKQWDSAETNPKYFEALKFIKANPNHPKAKEMLEKLKGGQ